MTTNHILELAICTVADKEKALAARQRAMTAVSAYPGFVSWRAVSGCETANMIADLVEWEDLGAAQAASKKVLLDPEFTPYMATITGVTLMQHFTTDNRI